MCYTPAGENQHGYAVEWSSCTKGTFEWALQQMRGGRMVRRKSWPDATSHLYILTRPVVLADQIRTVGQTGASQDTVWEPYDHVLATDWELYVKKCGSCGQQTR